MKGINKGRTYAKSVEYHDFEDMLDILKDAGAEPMFVVIPVNGKWYDYTGFPKKAGLITTKKSLSKLKRRAFRLPTYPGTNMIRTL